MNRKTRLVPLALGALLTLAMVVLHGAETPLGESARDAITDVYLRADPLVPGPERAVHIIDVDDASLAEIGQWPWPRTVMADLTDRLFDLGALAVGFDGIFPEPERSAAGAPGSSGALADGAARLAAALGAHATVLSVVGADAGGSPEGKAGIAGAPAST